MYAQFLALLRGSAPWLARLVCAASSFLLAVPDQRVGVTGGPFQCTFAHLHAFASRKVAWQESMRTMRLTVCLASTRVLFFLVWPGGSRQMSGFLPR